MPTVINPATGKTVREVPWHTAKEIEARLTAARDAYIGWRGYGFTQRAECLKAVAAHLRKDRDRHASLTGLSSNAKCPGLGQGMRSPAF